MTPDDDRPGVWSAARAASDPDTSDDPGFGRLDPVIRADPGDADGAEP